MIIWSIHSNILDNVLLLTSGRSILKTKATCSTKKLAFINRQKSTQSVRQETQIPHTTLQILLNCDFLKISYYGCQWVWLLPDPQTTDTEFGRSPYCCGFIHSAFSNLSTLIILPKQYPLQAVNFDPISHVVPPWSCLSLIVLTIQCIHNIQKNILKWLNP
jgi:hypothetical protein